jgi:TrkA domain protein
METTRSTVPGTGALHDCRTRDGQQFRIFVDRPGRREIFVYDPVEPDRVAARIVLEEDEADQISGLLCRQPVADRIAELERRITQLAGKRG